MYESLIKNNNSLITVASQVQQSMEIIHSDITSAEKLLETSRKANIFGTVVVSLVGLIGHFLIILVFGQKRFRTNSCNVYLLCLALNDSMFLIVHVIKFSFFFFQLKNKVNIYFLFLAVSRFIT
jgi:hypothetical protein